VTRDWSLKGRYPWLVGAPSFVIPADIITNVRYLAPRVDGVQLLFFESAANTRLPQEVDIQTLRQLATDHDLAYTVHLPADIRLGAADQSLRQQGIDEVVRLVTELLPLAPHSFDLHLQWEANLARQFWLENLDHSLDILVQRLGEEAGKIAIENIEYDMRDLRPLLTRHDMSFCLDMGHILRYGHDWSTALHDYVPGARHVHYHGVCQERDHRAIGNGQEQHSTDLGAALARTGYRKMLTIEQYDEAGLAASADTLIRAWANFELEGE